MRDESNIVRGIQRVIREQLDKRGLALKVIAADSGIPYSTLCSYFPGNEREAGQKQAVELPTSALRALCGKIPADLLSLLMPDDFALVRVPSGVDYDEFSEGCRDFIAAKDRAHHPESEAGRDIGPTEQAELGNKVVRLAVRA